MRTKKESLKKRYGKTWGQVLELRDVWAKKLHTPSAERPVGCRCWHCLWPSPSCPGHTTPISSQLTSSEWLSPLPCTTKWLDWGTLSDACSSHGTSKRALCLYSWLVGRREFQSGAPEGDQRQCGAVTQLVTSKKLGKKLERNGGGEVTLHFIDKGTRKMRPLFVFCVDRKFFLSSRKSPEKESLKKRCANEVCKKESL